MSGVRRFFADLLFGVLPDSSLCAMGDCDAALSTALSRLLTMPSAGSETCRRFWIDVLLLHRHDGCCVRLDPVQLACAIIELLRRRCRVSGRNRIADIGWRTVICGRGTVGSADVYRGRRYCQSLTASVDCRRCSSVNATDASAGRASTARAVRWARNAATPSLMPLQAVAMLGTSS